MKKSSGAEEQVSQSAGQVMHRVGLHGDGMGRQAFPPRVPYAYFDASARP